MNNNININRDIQSETRREILRELGPFCIWCGFPGYQFHHINEYSKLKNNNINPHDTNNIVPLCEIHHLAGVHKYQQIRSDMLIKKRLELKKDKKISSQFCAKKVPPVVFLGKNQNSCEHILVAENQSLFSLSCKNNVILVNAKFFDSDSRLIFEIKENRWIMDKKDIWDIEITPNCLDENLNKECFNLKIQDKDRRKKNPMVLDIDFKPSEGIFINQSRFYYKGNILEIDSNGDFLVNTPTVKNARISNCQINGMVAYAFKPDPIWGG